MTAHHFFFFKNTTSSRVVTPMKKILKTVSLTVTKRSEKKRKYPNVQTICKELKKQTLTSIFCQLHNEDISRLFNL